MTRYFMRDTPLCQMEQQMMTPPYFKPRGHGRYYPGFQYSRDDMECPYCMNFRRNHPCPLEQCVCLDERLVAGAIDLNEFVRDCFFPEAGVQLQARLERCFKGCSIGFFLSDSHRERWQHWRARCYRMSGRNLAALFLLTAYEDSPIQLLAQVADMKSYRIVFASCSEIAPDLFVNLCVGQHTAFVGGQQQENPIFFCGKLNLLSIPKNLSSARKISRPGSDTIGSSSTSIFSISGWFLRIDRICSKTSVSLSCSSRIMTRPMISPLSHSVYELLSVAQRFPC